MPADADAGLAQSFYDQHGANEAEAERLRRMAGFADEVSIRSLEPGIDAADALIVDIGAGDSTSLGEAIRQRNPSAGYVPIDLRQDAVQAHLQAGFDARVGFATDLPMDSGSASSLHTRFTMAWLDSESRGRALEEMIRVGREGAELAVIDYDWSAAQGPEPVDLMIERLTSLMRSFGFDPYYGSVSRAEIETRIRAGGYTEADATVTEQRTPVVMPMSAAVPTIGQTVLPVIAKMREIGDTAEAEALAGMMADIEEYGAGHPDEAVCFPDIVSVIVRQHGGERRGQLLDRLETARQAGVRLISQETLRPAGPPSYETFLLPPQLVHQARRLHGRSYRSHGHVTDEGLNPDGTLIEEIDAQATVDASAYIGQVNAEGTVTGCIRIIEPAGGDYNLLPTVVKLRQTLGDDNLAWKALPFVRDGGRVMEGSALGKSSENKDRVILPKLLVSAVLEGLDRGYDYAVMGVVKSAARLMTATYGSGAFRRIDGDSAVVRLQGTGLNPKGVELVPFYVDLRTFVDDCIAHVETLPDSYHREDNLAVLHEARSFLGFNGKIA